jgi:sulfate permease, SulP family
MLAGILIVVAYNMGEWREIPQLLKLTKTDISVWLVTVALTIFADLTVAVEAGMILAALLFISRVASIPGHRRIRRRRPHAYPAR